MNKGSRPSGRTTRTGSGGMNVGRRGTGIGRSSSGPVGGSGGFFRRPGGQSSSGFGSSNAGGPFIPRSYNRPINTGSSKIIIILLVVFLGIFLISRLFGGGVNPPDDQPGFSSPLVKPGNTTFDSGAYAVNRLVSENSRPKHITLSGDGKDKVTVMVYLLGTDLESRGGLATMDLQEMQAAKLSPKVNIVIQTGGTAKWKNNVISSKTNQRYLLNSQGFSVLEEDAGRRSMVDPGTLTDFIQFSEGLFPAERYFLILWDHGGGSVTGYGYDEHFKGDTMTLDEIGNALENAGTKFDLIGFDACLMATLETALVVEPYADYLIASEELEPGIGWYYTGWLNEISKNTSIATIDIGKKLIDDYIVEVKRKTPKSQATLSLIDLAELSGTLPNSFGDFARSIGELVESDDYKKVSDSRVGTKEFAASSRINQIDLIDFSLRLGTPQAGSLAQTLISAVKYNRMSDNISNANGLSIYFPYGKLSDLSSIVKTYDEIGMDEEYTDAIKSFANLNAGGQMASQGGGLLGMLLAGGQSGGSTSQGTGTQVIGSLINSFLNQGDFSSLTGGSQQAPDWLNTEQITDSTQYYSENMIDPASIKITTKNGRKVLVLSEEEWSLVHTLELSVFVDDGSGFIDLGRDNVFEYNADGDLLLEYDGTWPAINGAPVSYYMSSYDIQGDDYKILGRVPAMLNGQLVDIVLSFDQDEPYGEVLGARIIYDDGSETPNLPKGLVDIKPGDRIDYLCDYYSYEGDFDDTYYLGDQYIADGNWYIENLAINDLDFLMSYKITDIYGNTYWTPAVTD